jgi:hypothetical protein
LDHKDNFAKAKQPQVIIALWIGAERALGKFESQCQVRGAKLYLFCFKVAINSWATTLSYFSSLD